MFVCGFDPRRVFFCLATGYWLLAGWFTSAGGHTVSKIRWFLPSIDIYHTRTTRRVSSSLRLYSVLSRSSCPFWNISEGRFPETMKSEPSKSIRTSAPVTKEQDVDELVDQIHHLGLKESDDSAAPPPPHVKRVARWIEEGTLPNIVVLSGAGVSCSAGIPDFRTPGTGLYDNLQKYNLPYPEAVFDLKFYQRNPKPFCSLAREIWPGLKHSPTLAHSFVALLARKGRLLRNYSQNIDGLEFLATIPSEQTVECHGHFRTASCIRCHANYDGGDCKTSILQQGQVPKCDRKHCGGYVKPDIVFFGEDLPDRYGRLLRGDLKKADLLLIMGTSLMVAPVSMIPNMVHRTCRRVLINRDLVGNLDVTENDDNDNDNNDDDDAKSGRDVFLEGDCDEQVLALCRLLGWEEELFELNESTKITPQNDDLKTDKQNK